MSTSLSTGSLKNRQKQRRPSRRSKSVKILDITETGSERIANLIEASKDKDNSSKLKALIDDQAYVELINITDTHDDYTPLIWASKSGNIDSVRLLCACEAIEVNKQAGWNETTALMQAVKFRKGRDVAIVRALCEEFGARADIQNQFGMTALMLTAEQSNRDPEGSAAILNILLSQDADISRVNKEGFTALSLAAQSGCYKALATILKHEKVSLDPKVMEVPLLIAAEMGHFDMVQLLVNMGANPNAYSQRGSVKMTVLMHAAVERQASIVEFLLKHGADPTFTIGDQNESSLSMACVGGDQQIVESIIHAWKMKKKLPEEALARALLSACEEGKKDVVMILMTTVDKVKRGKILLDKKKGGNTCLMHACKNGHLSVILFILEVVSEIMEMQPTRVLESPILSAVNDNGKSSMDLLAEFYRDHDFNTCKIGSFLKVAAQQNAKKPYLLDLLPQLLPFCKSPDRVMNKHKRVLFQSLKNLSGTEADVQLVGALVNIAIALREAAAMHYVEQRDLIELSNQVQLALVECMHSPSMDDRDNVTLVLRRGLSAHDSALPSIVVRAMAMYRGPLSECVNRGLTKVLATSQIINHVEEVLYSSLKWERPRISRSFKDLLQLRSGCASLRFSPIAMFMFSGMCKALHLFIVSYALIFVYVPLKKDHADFVSQEGAMSTAATILSTTTHAEATAAALGGNFILGMWLWDTLLVTMLVSSTVFEMGEIWEKLRKVRRVADVTIVAKVFTVLGCYWSDKWNQLDLLCIVFGTTWCWYRFWWDDIHTAEAFLAWTSIGLSFSLLRYLSNHRELGKLVIMFFEMIADLATFAVIFAISVIGFGIAFMGLFSDVADCRSDVIYLKLFDAAIGNHPDFDIFNDRVNKLHGVIMMVVFVALVMIVLLNLVVARMSDKHDRVEEESLEAWAKAQAINVTEFSVLYRRHPCCMLPPPLNMVSALCSLPSVLPRIAPIRRRDTVHSLDVVGEPSSVFVAFAGTLSNQITSLFYSVPCALWEIWLANKSLENVSVQIIIFSMLLAPTFFLMFLLEIWRSIWCHSHATAKWKPSQSQPKEWGKEHPGTSPKVNGKPSKIPGGLYQRQHHHHQLQQQYQNLSLAAPGPVSNEIRAIQPGRFRSSHSKTLVGEREDPYAECTELLEDDIVNLLLFSNAVVLAAYEYGLTQYPLTKWWISLLTFGLSVYLIQVVHPQQWLHIWQWSIVHFVCVVVVHSIMRFYDRVEDTYLNWYRQKRYKTASSRAELHFGLTEWREEGGAENYDDTDEDEEVILQTTSEPLSGELMETSSTRRQRAKPFYSIDKAATEDGNGSGSSSGSNSSSSSSGGFFLVLTLKQAKLGVEDEQEFFARRLNPIVLISYDTSTWQSEGGRPSVRDGGYVWTEQNVIIPLNETVDFSQELIVEIFDRVDLVEDGSFVRVGSSIEREDSLLGHARVYIKLWIANEHFQGIIRLFDTHEVDSGHIELKVKLTHASDLTPSVTLLDPRGASQENSSSSEFGGAVEKEVLFKPADRERIFSQLLKSDFLPADNDSVLAQVSRSVQELDTTSIDSLIAQLTEAKDTELIARSRSFSTHHAVDSPSVALDSCFSPTGTLIDESNEVSEED